jgi:hypothetical protein
MCGNTTSKNRASPAGVTSTTTDYNARTNLSWTLRRVRQVLDQLSPTDGVEEIADALLASAGDSGQLTDDVAMVVIRLST